MLFAVAELLVDVFVARMPTSLAVWMMSTGSPGDSAALLQRLQADSAAAWLRATSDDHVTISHHAHAGDSFTQSGFRL